MVVAFGGLDHPPQESATSPSPGEASRGSVPAPRRGEKRDSAESCPELIANVQLGDIKQEDDHILGTPKIEHAKTAKTHWPRAKAPRGQRTTSRRLQIHSPCTERGHLWRSFSCCFSFKGLYRMETWGCRWNFSRRLHH